MKNIKVVCECGDEFETDRINFFKERRQHLSSIAKKKDGKSHSIKEIIDTDTGEKAESEGEAIDKDLIISRKEYKMIKDKFNIDDNPQDNSKQGGEKVNIKTSIKGEVLETEVPIHPWVFDTFVIAMNVWPERYEKDEQINFGKFIFDVVVFFRNVTMPFLDWDNFSKETYQELAETSNQEENNNKEKLEKEETN